MTPSSLSSGRRWLHRFAVGTALATLALIGIGGLVTSHEAGMAVPDWPTSYGYNMFFFPLAHWWHSGNVFYEHSHRLFASGVGLLTTILAVWLGISDPRRWMRWLGVAAFIAVVLQGVLGGLRVTLVLDELGIFHAALAQLFFALICSIALFTSPWWIAWENSAARRADHSVASPFLRKLFLATTVLIFVQLLLGATMRHQHAGLAIWDFPLAHGKLWPAMDAASVAQYNQQRDELNSTQPITGFQVGLQMTHRLLAVIILGAVAVCAWKVRSSGFSRSGPPEGGTPNGVRRLALFWFALILIQAGLGAWTVLSHKAADIATTHVLAGALSLATGAVLCIISRRSPVCERSAAAFGAGRRAHGNSLATGTAAT